MMVIIRWCCCCCCCWWWWCMRHVAGGTVNVYNMAGVSGPLQIGDHNVMHLNSGSARHHRSQHQPPPPSSSTRHRHTRPAANKPKKQITGKWGNMINSDAMFHGVWCFCCQVARHLWSDFSCCCTFTTCCQRPIIVTFVVEALKPKQLSYISGLIVKQNKHSPMPWDHCDHLENVSYMLRLPRLLIDGNDIWRVWSREEFLHGYYSQG